MCVWLKASFILVLNIYGQTGKSKSKKEEEDDQRKEEHDIERRGARGSLSSLELECSKEVGPPCEGRVSCNEEDCELMMSFA